MLPVVRDWILLQERQRQRRELIRRRISLRSRSNPFDFPDQRFRELFRLDKRLVRNLMEELRPLLEDRKSMKGVDFESKIFCALRYYAVGSYQRCVGQDFILGLSQTTVHRCVKAVTRAIVVLAENQIRMPDTINERNNIKFEFMDKWGFPGTVGAIDCFHVAILKPHVNEHNFINRKGFHSLNVQVICDHKLVIRSIWANFGGSTHDSYIWRVSEANRFMRDLHANHENTWVIGDSGYPLQPYLLTPFREANNQAQQNYNLAHARARNWTERCIGCLKQRFRCLLQERTGRYDPHFTSLVVKACAYLQNLCIEANIPFEEVYYADGDEPNPRRVVDPNDGNNVQQLGIYVRQQITNLYFR